MIQIVANILDFPRPGLSPEIWEPSQNLKSEVKNFILDFISSFAKANNFKDTSAWITDVKVVGSLTTNCWNSHSDMDVHIVVDLPKFVEIEHPEMSDKDASNYLDEIRKQVDQVKAKVPGTEHPTEIYFETEFTTHASQEFSGTYSVLQDAWLEYPHIVDQNFDIEKLYPDLLNLAKETASELDEAFGELKRDVADIKDLQAAIEAWPEAQRSSFQKKLETKLDTLGNEIKELVDMREDVAEKRKHYNAISEQEVRFKYLQKFWYMHVLTDLKTLLKQSPELTVKDIPVVENIMLQAQVTPEEETQLDQTLMIDFDATIAHENPDCRIGEPMKGVKEVLTDLKNQGYHIVIYSHRGNTEEGTDEIKEFMDKYEIPYDEIYQGEKPLAFRYIDDRAIQFTDWNSVLKQVEKAENKKEASLSIKYWIDPSGKEYEFGTRLGHYGFVMKMLGIDPYESHTDEEQIKIEEQTEKMFEDGWSRITPEGSGQFAIEVYDMKNLPKYLDNFIAKHFDRSEADKGWHIEIDDQSGSFVQVLEPFPTLQDAVNKKLSGQMSVASQVPLSKKEAQLGSVYDFSSTHFLLPKELAEKIIRWAVETIPEDEIVHDSKDKAPSTKGIQLESHITLKYGLLTDDFEEVKKALEGEKAPHIKFGKTSFFEPEGKDYDVIIIPVESEDLQKLNEKLCSQVEHEDLQFKEYHPHVTVAYIKKGLGKNYNEKDIITGEELDLDVLTFSPKEGSKQEMELGKVTEKKASRFEASYWIDPNGNTYKIDTEMDETHLDWVGNNLEILMNKFHLPETVEVHEMADNMISVGWTRAIVSDDGIIFDRGSLDNLDILDTFVAKNWNPNRKEVVIDTGKASTIYVTDPFPSLQEAISNGNIKESSFMPSNTDLAPSNDWISETGYPGNSEMDSPQNVSDEQTWYSPENDRPRSKNFLKRMLSLFQKPLSKKEPKEIVPVKEASSNVFMLDDVGTGLQTKALKDPTPEQAANLFNNARGEIKMLRWASDVNGHLYIWDAYHIVHYHALKQIPADFGQDLNTGVLHSAEEASKWAARFQKDWEERSLMRQREKEEIEKQIPIAAKQWTTPQEQVNQPGMDWGWVDYIYNYVDENWQDLLHDWLNLDPKNYVKPVVLIEKIYEDEGAVSAWVHIEFVNTIGNTDAYMKLVVTGDTHYEPSYEPEGVDTVESLEDIEIEVLDYGIADSLEKDSSYGPTNFKGPSTPDTHYQDSAFDMNVTWSPEQDDELDEQNGKGGYPQRWYGRPRSKYYTNEGKVVKMLEETSAALSKKDMEKKAIGNMSGWLAPDGKFYLLTGSHSGWVDKNMDMLQKKYHISLEDFEKEYLGLGPNEEDNSVIDILIRRDWVRVDGNLPNELDLELYDLHNIPESVERFVWKYKPEVVIVEDLNGNDTSFDKEEYSKGLMQQATLKIKADISGKIVNDILHLIQTTGGATYSLSKGNLVGTDGYAVAIYPDREQIVSQLDYDTVEEYLLQNEDLLSNSANSFGAWISGGNKVYLDVVAVIKDLNEAMKLGRKHNQLAIFNLKTLQEIPIQKLAKLAAAVSDRQQQEYYDQIYSDRWREDSDKIDGGFQYYDFPEGGQDYPGPEDEHREHCLLDQLQKPIDRNVPQGLGEFQITWYDAMPSEGDHGGI